MDSGNILSVNVPNAISIGVMAIGLIVVVKLAQKLMQRRTSTISNTPRASWPASGGV